MLSDVYLHEGSSQPADHACIIAARSIVALYKDVHSGQRSEAWHGEHLELITKALGLRLTDEELKKARKQLPTWYTWVPLGSMLQRVCCCPSHGASCCTHMMIMAGLGLAVNVS